MIAAIVRLLGATIMVIGIIAAVMVIREAWNLYQEPEGIERLAVAIETGSNLDKLVASVAGGAAAPAAAAGPAGAAGTAAAPADAGQLRLTYFVAWFLAALLLLIIGMLAMAAIQAGGKVALYDMQLRKFARQVATEARRRD